MTIFTRSGIAEGVGVSVIGDGFDGVAARSHAHDVNDYNGYDYTDGDDVIIGTGNDDDLRGGAGNDTLSGLGGDDTLEGGDGNDSLNGGPGDDRLFGDVGYWGYGEGGSDTLIGGDGADWMLGGGGNDSLVGGNGSDWIVGGRGADTLTGGGGRDLFTFKCGAFYGGEISDISADEFDGDEITDLSPGDLLEFGIAIFTQADVTRTDDADSTRLDIDIDGDGFSDGTITFSSRVSRSLGVVMTGGNEYGGPFTVIGTTSSSLGTAYDDTLQGGSEPDVVGGGDGNDSISGGGGGDLLGGDSGDDTLNGEAGDDSLYGGAGDDIVFGGDGADYIGYGDGNDTLDGGAGADTLYGGVGDDVLRCGSGDDHANGGEGNDLIFGGDGNDGELNGNAGNDTIYGGSGNDRSYGGDESDVIFGGDGNDTLNGGWEYHGYGSVPGDDSLDGGAGNDRLYMESGNDTLRGGAGNDIFQTTGSWDATGRPLIADLAVGDQIRVGSAGYSYDVVFLGVDTNNEQSDFLVFDFDGDGSADRSIIVGGHFTKAMFKAEYKNSAGWTGLVVQLKQAPLPVLMQGDDDDNTLESLNGNNTLDGLGGDDVVISGAGNDALRGGEGNDWVSFAPFSCAVTANLATGKAGGTESGTDTLTEIENIRGGYGDDTLTGDGGDNVLHGNSGNDRLDGNAGDDTIDGGHGKDAVKGGDGDDLFLIRVDEAANDSFDGGKGLDTIRNDGAGDVVFNVFKPTAIEVFDNTGTDGLAHAILGTAGNDTLNFAGLTLIGVTGIHGLAGNDNLTGNDANNLLDGGAGNDTMAGGKGDDTYVVDSSGDKIVEKKNEGIDSVTITGFSAGKAFTLANDVENLLLAGAFALAVTGNALANEIVGNDGANTITGAGGNDTVTGGGGADVFVMSASMGIDLVTDFAVGEGDTLDFSKLGLTLAQVLGVLIQDGADAKFDFGKNGAVILDGVDGAGLAPAQFVTKAFSTMPQQGDDEANTIGGAPGSSKDFLIGWGGADSLSGGDGNDTLVGGFGSDTLDGGAGTDSLLGGDGDDLYRVDNSGDKVVEVAGGGTDTVESTATCTLAAFVENLTLTGAAKINGTGNELANVIIGNGANNGLDGKAGNDTLIGGIGADTLTGGKGADCFVYETVADSGVKANKEAIDIITDFKSGEDLIDLHLLTLVVGPFAIVTDSFSGGGDNPEALFNGGLLSIDLDGNGVSDFDIAMTGLKTIADSDFLL